LSSLTAYNTPQRPDLPMDFYRELCVRNSLNS